MVSFGLRGRQCHESQISHLPCYFVLLDPACESHDLSAIENSFANSPIPFHPNDPQYNWANPGDCAKFNTEITSGKGFNGRVLDSCESNGKILGTHHAEGKKVVNVNKVETSSAQYPYIPHAFITKCELARHSFATTELPPLTQSLGFIKPHNTGSSTISNIVNQILDVRDLNNLIPLNNMHIFGFESKLLYNVDNVMKVTKYDAITNHAIFNSTSFRRYLKDQIVLFTILREPVSRVISAYNWFESARKSDS